MSNKTTEAFTKNKSYRDAYDVDFNFDFKFSLTDYIIVSLYLILALPVELVSRVVSDCYSAYQNARAHREEMMPLFME